MRWLGDKPFHTFLLLTEKPARWAPWQIVPISLGLAALAGMIWARVTGEPAWGWATALGLLAFALLDWGLLVSLPRRGFSFGAVQPPFLALSVVRWMIALLAVPLAASWPLPAAIGLAFVQSLISVLGAYGTMIEPFRLQVTHVAVPTLKLANPGVPLCIVQLSDLHIERLTRRERALPDLVASLAPDLLVLTGDFLSTSYNTDTQALDDLRTLLAQFRASHGIYAIWGTIEVDLPELLRPILQDLGIVVLQDEASEVLVGDARLWLMGPACSRDLVADGQVLRDLLARAPSDAFTMLLYHTPDLMPQASALGIDLYLAGHTHGGQWRLPGFGAFLTSSHYWKRYEAGPYRKGDTLLYVSRGLGMEGFGTPRARLFCPPEVVVLGVTRQEQGD